VKLNLYGEAETLQSAKEAPATKAQSAYALVDVAAVSAVVPPPFCIAALVALVVKKILLVVAPVGFFVGAVSVASFGVLKLTFVI
jgi:hypothetical protein